SSAATGGTPRRWPTPASSCRPSTRPPSPRTPRRCRPWSGTCSSLTPPSRRPRPSGSRPARPGLLDSGGSAMHHRLRPAVLLDRGGVLPRVPVRAGAPPPPQGPGEFELLPGVVEAAGRLADAGWPLVVVTNQPDVARGTQTREAVERIN